MKNFILSALAAIGLFTGCNAQSQVKVLVPEAFITAVEGDTTAVILDVRRPSEYAEGHLAKAINIDWLNQEAFSKALPTLDKRRTYYVYCRSGRRRNEDAGRRLQGLRHGRRLPPLDSRATSGSKVNRFKIITLCLR